MERGILMKKVLIVEDDHMIFFLMKAIFAGRVEILWAEELKQGEYLFENNPDIDLIIMDACVPGNKPNSMPLIEKIVKSGFDEPILASSSSHQFSQQLVWAGATYIVDKNNAAKKALELLGLI